MAPHPLAILSLDEIAIARELVLEQHDGALVDFREIFLQEPAKAELRAFLDLEHSGSLTATSPRPARQARAQYDVISSSKIPEFHESIVDLSHRKVVVDEIVSTTHHASLTVAEFEVFLEVCKASPMFQEELAKISLPEGFEVIVEPWPYGGPDKGTENRRFFQGLCFAQDKRSGNEDSNFYPYPLPIIPVMDYREKKIIRIDRPATGGKGDPITGQSHAKGVIDHCAPGEYVPELLATKQRTDLKPINIIQPEGTSFTVTDESLVEWQKWRFRVGFNPREGATIHDVHYDGRSILYRLAISEMTVPYADPRAPFHRKQAFDFGDGALGANTNNLQLGCDCLGVIKYFDGNIIGPDGKGTVANNVICLHEQDAGILWKHQNWRTGRAVVTRNRELVIQFIITLANYEYVFAFKFNLAGAIEVETRATGIVSVVNIDPGKTSYYGNVVSPGALAQNHQHIFCIRIDPAIDGHNNTVLHEESHRVPISEEWNPNGNLYEVRQTVINKSQWIDAAPQNNRTFKMINPSKFNPISGKPVGYKITPLPTQLLLADPTSVQSKRALFAHHHMWVTKYKDGELYAGGKYTLQSQLEIDGVADAASRADDVEDEDVVVWTVFGLTHNPRVEDWPVMPAEMKTVSILPSDFFSANPSMDVPATRNLSSRLVERVSNCCNGATTNGA